MTDLRIQWAHDGGDLVQGLEDLELDEGLTSAVLVSLFSDGRREPDPLLPVAAQDLRGWWGEQDGDPFGSLLWTLAREKLTPETVARARDLARDALAWLVSNEIARAVDVEADLVEPGVLRLAVHLTRGDAIRWAHVWRGTEGVSLRSPAVLLELTFS